jgi:hypothetical protein
MPFWLMHPLEVLVVGATAEFMFHFAEMLSLVVFHTRTTEGKLMLGS